MGLAPNWKWNWSKLAKVKSLQVAILIGKNQCFRKMPYFAIILVVQENRFPGAMPIQRFLQERDAISQLVVHVLRFVVQPFLNERRQTEFARISLHRRRRHRHSTGVVGACIAIILQMRIGRQIGMLEEREGTWLETPVQVSEVTLDHVAFDMNERVERKDEIDAGIVLGKAQTVVQMEFGASDGNLVPEPVLAVRDALFRYIVCRKGFAMG